MAQLNIYNPFEDELKRRMAAAKAQGWSEDEINRSALIERAMQKSRVQQEAQEQQQKQQAKKKTGRGGTATSLISEGSAAAGALGGAAAGSVVPGVGTVIGGIIGGLLGGFGGSAAEQKVRDDEVDWGKAGIEGLFSAVPGGAGKVAKGAIEKNVAKQVLKPQPGAITSRVRQAGTNIRASNRGAVAGSDIQGRTDRLLPREAQQATDFMDELGAKGSVKKQLSTIEQRQSKVADDINTIVSREAKPVGNEDLFNAQNRIRDRIIGANGQGVGGFDPATHGAIANRYAQQMAGIKDSQGWLNFKRSLDKDINYARSNQSVDPKVEQIAEVFRKEASDQLGRLHPEVVPLNKFYSQAENAKNILVRRANPSGFKPAGTSFNNKGVGGPLIQNVVDRSGRTIQRTADAFSTPALGQLSGQIAASTVANQFVPDRQQVLPNSAQQQMQPAFSNPQTVEEQMLNELTSGGINDFDTLSQALNGNYDMSQLGGMTPGNQTGLQYSSTDLFNSAMAALAAGDTKAANQFADFAELAAEFEQTAAKNSGAQGDGPNVTKVTAQQYGLAQSGATAVAQLQQLLQQDPNVLTRSATPGRGLPIVGGFISNAAGTGDFDAIGYNIADTILRLRTGATANESEVRKLQSQIMPRAGDSQQTVQTKLQQINDIFGNVLNLAGNGTASSPEEELMRMLSGGY